MDFWDKDDLLANMFEIIIWTWQAYNAWFKLNSVMTKAVSLFFATPGTKKFQTIWSRPLAPKKNNKVPTGFVLGIY